MHPREGENDQGERLVVTGDRIICQICVKYSKIAYKAHVQSQLRNKALRDAYARHAT